MKPLASFGLRIFAVLASILVFPLILIVCGMVVVLVISLMIVLPFLLVLNVITLLTLGKTLEGKTVEQLWNEALKIIGYGSGSTKR